MIREGTAPSHTPRVFHRGGTRSDRSSVGRVVLGAGWPLLFDVGSGQVLPQAVPVPCWEPKHPVGRDPKSSTSKRRKIEAGQSTLSRVPVWKAHPRAPNPRG